MSTRSGKRIHSSISENVETVSELPTVKKTRRKRVKEYSDEEITENKKKITVTSPNDKTKSPNNSTEYESKSVRKSKRHTLKEINTPVVDCEAPSGRKSMRHSRRTRKEDTIESKNVPIQENVKRGKEKKKNKKTKKAVIEDVENEPDKAAIVIKKKTSKKKWKSNTFIVEELVTGEHNKSFNRSNVSIDSFHSAAGSPVKDNLNNEEGIDSNSLSSYNSVDNLKDTKKRSKKKEKNKLSASNELSLNKNEDMKEKDENKFKKEISGNLKTKTKIKKSKETNLRDFENTITKAEFKKSMELHSFIESNIHSRDLNRKSIEINYKNSPTFKIDHVNVPLCNGTIDDYDTLNNSCKEKRKSISKNTTSNKRDTSLTLLNESTKELSVNVMLETDVSLDEIIENHTTSVQKPCRTKSKDATCEKIDLSNIILNHTFDKTNNSFNKNSNAVKELSFNKRKNSRRASSIQNIPLDNVKDNLVGTDTTINNKSFNNSNADTNSTNSNDTKSKKSSKVSLSQDIVYNTLNGTYDKISTDESTSLCDNTYDKSKLDTTFEKIKDSIDGMNRINVNPKTSIISSDNTDMTSDMSQDHSINRISISDDSTTENIGNTTPLLIESSINESQIDSSNTLLNKTATPREKKDVGNVITPDRQGSLSDNNKRRLSRGKTFTETKTTDLKGDGTITELRKTPQRHRSTLIKESQPQDSENLKTPLKREGTFTKDSPDVMSPKWEIIDKTPTRRKSTSSPGRTPFVSSGGGHKGRAVLNLTHSIEKPRRRSSESGAPRMTKVMFRSPLDNPVAVTQMKGKVIKSSMKGSNRSFMFDETAPSLGGARKRSRTHVGAEESAKRARLAAPRPLAAPRARTASAAARLQASVGAEATPPISKSDAKLRTKLPDFAALHQKQFSKMESLDECQRRRARRARALLTPTGPTASRTPTAPAAVTAPTASTAPTAPTAPIALAGTLRKNNSKEFSDIVQSQTTKRTEIPKSKEIDKKNQSYTRFGFKLNLDVNPFNVPPKTGAINAKDVRKPQALVRQATLPSLAGATQRKELAKQTVMREKSFADRRHVNRDQNRTLIKGVRTNRRFELQMKMRNID